MGLKERIESVLEKIEKAAAKSGRKLNDITLVAVTKTVPVEKIKEAYNLGIKIFGENRVQEARWKIEQLKDLDIEWHMIGHLQRNKAKYAVRLFSMIQSVDSYELACELEKRAFLYNIKEVPVLIEVKISPEETKFGIPPEGVPPLIERISKELKRVKIKGLMTIAPFVPAEETRPYFQKVKRLFDDLDALDFPGVEMRYLSMGMSNDFEVAIEEGANMVRIGTAIFGPRE